MHYSVETVRTEWYVPLHGVNIPTSKPFLHVQNVLTHSTCCSGGRVCGIISEKIWIANQFSSHSCVNEKGYRKLLNDL